MDKGHISIGVSGVTYPLLVDLKNYTEVDAVDFAPGAVAGSSALSELGLYLDVGQVGFQHGFGRHTYSEPESYALTGTGVDTRHGFASLYTAPAATDTGGGYTFANRLYVHRTVVVILSSYGFMCKKADGSWYLDDIHASVTPYDMIDTGEYILLGNSGRLRVADVGIATGGAATTLTNSGAAWDTNIFAGATVVIYDGTGAGSTGTVTSNTATQITCSGGWSGTAPAASSRYIVRGVTGSGTNVPNGFYRLQVFGGYFWGFEYGTNRLHHWATANGSTAEGGTGDANVVYVGPTGVPIVNMFSFNNMLWVAKADSIYNVGEDDLAYFMLGFTDEASASNFKTAVTWQGFLYFPVRNTMYKYKSGLQDVTPPTWDETIPYKQFGNFDGLTVRGRWMYMLGQSNASNSTDESQETDGFVALMATNGVGWHKLYDIPLTTPSAFGAFLDPINNILYAWAKPASGNTILYSFQLQTYSDLPYASFPTSGNHYLYTSYYDMGYMRINKSFASLVLRADYQTNTSLVVSFRLDSTTTWTSLGTFTSDMQEISFPTATVGKRVQFRIGFVSTTATNTPILKGLIMKLMIRPEVLYAISCRVLVESNNASHDYIPTGLTAAETRAALKAARASEAPITFTDIHGTSASAYLTTVRFVLVEYQDINTWDEVAICTFVYV